MANLAVTTNPQQLEVDRVDRVVLQNLGAGVVYWGEDETVSVETGMKLAVGESYDLLRPQDEGIGEAWVVGDAAADLRYQRV